MATRPLTDREKAEHNPPFNVSRTTANITAPPPFTFPRTNLHYFPVRADLGKLQDFCDNYLNAAPEFAYFKPAMPFVLILMNYYPKMGYAEGNLGWISQNEVLFVVPLEWYEPTDDGLVFRDFAQFSPFAFVDKDASQVEGREVYGWPKVEGWFTSSVSSWLEDPRARRTVLELHTHGFQALYRDQYDQALPLMKITQNPPVSFTAIPPEVGGPWDPLTNIGLGAQELGNLMRSGFFWASNQLMSALQSGRDIPSSLMTDIQERIRNFSVTLQGNTVNFKQIRDAEDPGTACYQAVTNAAMEVQEFHRGGMLGDLALLRGDLSGGYEIELCNYPSIPIVDSLGLQVSNNDPNAKLCTLRPVMPFWQELTLKYLTGDNLAWRAWDGERALWRNQEKIEVEAPASHKEPKYLRRPPYMTEAGANFQVAEGPFRLPEASLMVLPLKADRQVLTEFLQNGPGDMALQSGSLPDAWVPKSLMSQLPRDIGYFEPWGGYVYLVVAHFHEMVSARNDFGTIAENHAVFAVPVKFCRGEGDNKEVLSVGYISPFMYSTNDIAATTGRELSGYTTVRAGIESSPNTWLTKEGPLSDHVPLFDIHAEMPAALTGGQPFEWRRLLQVIEGNTIPWNDDTAWQRAEPFVAGVQEDMQRMHELQRANHKPFRDFMSLALGVYSGTPINQFSFKQFRDAHDPNDACYQALVRSQFVIDRVYHQQDLEKRLHVNLYRYPTQPVVQSLGLEVKSTHHTADGVYDTLQPIRPFYLKADLHTERGKNLTCRSGTTRWSPLHMGDEVQPQFYGVGRRAVKEMRRNPGRQLLKEKRLQVWLRENPDVIGCTREEYQHLLEGPFEPQMAISNALSHEWGNDLGPRWYRAKQQPEQIYNLLRCLKEVEDDTSAEADDYRRMIQLKIDYLTAFPQQQLPDYVLRCDMAGTEERRLFPTAERVSGEDAVSYWTPDARFWLAPHSPDGHP